jgi:hypothetical protein
MPYAPTYSICRKYLLIWYHLCFDDFARWELLEIIMRGEEIKGDR